MTTIHLVRHGQTHWNLERRVQGRTESTLTDLGVEQARQVAIQLQDINLDRAYASSSVRARDTARYILEHHDGVNLELRDDLREIFLGDWEGQLYAEVKQSHPDQHRHFWEDPSLFSLEGAEDFYQLQQRAAAAVESIAADNAGKTILIVSHGAFIKALLSRYEGRHLRDFWNAPQMTNCCHSIVEKSPKGEFVICQYAGLEEW